MNSNRIVLAVDGNSLAHRAYYGYERSGLTNAAGEAIWGVYGFFVLLAGICQKVNPTAVVVGFDDWKNSVRKQRCPEYKATRTAKAPDLYTQMQTIQDLLRELGVSVVVASGLEADDVVASVSRSATASGWECVIATSDRDSFSLISDNTSVLRLVSGLDNAVMMTPDGLAEKYGVRPEQYLDYAALRGDSSDNLAGVKGIGEKTAAKLLDALGSLEAALANPDAVVNAVGKSAAAKLGGIDAREAITRNLDIMSLISDIEIDLEMATLTIDANQVSKVMRGAELPNLVKRCTSALCQLPSSRQPPVAEVEPWF